MGGKNIVRTIYGMSTKTNNSKTAAWSLTFCDIILPPQHKNYQKNLWNTVCIKVGEQIGKNLGKKSGKNVVVPGGYWTASPAPDLAPSEERERRAESFEGSRKLST